MNNPTLIPDGEDLWTRKQICEDMKITSKVLWRLERVGEGPPRITVGHTVRYPHSLYLKYLSQNLDAA